MESALDNSPKVHGFLTPVEVNARTGLFKPHPTRNVSKDLSARPWAHRFDDLEGLLEQGDQITVSTAMGTV